MPSGSQEHHVRFALPAATPAVSSTALAGQQACRQARAAAPRSAAPAAFVRRVAGEQSSPFVGASPATSSTDHSVASPSSASCRADARKPRPDHREGMSPAPVSRLPQLEEEDMHASDSDGWPGAVDDSRREEVQSQPTPYEVSLAQREAQWLSGAAELLRCADEIALAESQSEASLTSVGSGIPGIAMPSFQRRQRKMEEVLQRRLKTLRFLAEQQAVIGDHMDEKAACVPDEEQQVSEAHRLISEQADALAQRRSRLAEAQARLADQQQRCVEEVRQRQAQLQQRQDEIDECTEALKEAEAFFAAQEAHVAEMRRRFAEAEREAEQLKAERAILDMHTLEVDVREASLCCLDLAWDKALAQCTRSSRVADRDSIDSMHAVGVETATAELLRSDAYMQRLRKFVDTVLKSPESNRAISRNAGRTGSAANVFSRTSHSRLGAPEGSDAHPEAEGASAEESTAYAGEHEVEDDEEGQLQEDSCLRWKASDAVSRDSPAVDLSVTAVVTSPARSDAVAVSPERGRSTSGIVRSVGRRQEGSQSTDRKARSDGSGSPERAHSTGGSEKAPSPLSPKPRIAGLKPSPRQVAPTPSPGKVSGRMLPSAKPGIDMQHSSLQSRPSPVMSGVPSTTSASSSAALCRPPPSFVTPNALSRRTASAPPETPRQVSTSNGAHHTPSHPSLPAGVSTAGSSQTVLPGGVSSVGGRASAQHGAASGDRAVAPEGIATTGSILGPRLLNRQQSKMDSPKCVSPPSPSTSQAVAALLSATHRPTVSPLAGPPRPDSPNRSGMRPWSGTGAAAVPAATSSSSGTAPGPSKQPPRRSPSPHTNGQVGATQTQAAASSSSAPVSMKGHPSAANPTPRRVLVMPGTAAQSAGISGAGYSTTAGLQGLGFGNQASSMSSFHMAHGSQMPGGLARRPMVMGAMRV